MHDLGSIIFSIDLGLDFNWNDEVVVVVIPLPVTAGGVLPNGGARPAIPGALAGIEAMGPLFGAGLPPIISPLFLNDMFN